MNIGWGQSHKIELYFINHRKKIGLKNRQSMTSMKVEGSRMISPCLLVSLRKLTDREKNYLCGPHY